MATKSSITTLISTNIPDNITGLITPSAHRQVESALLDYALRDQVIIEDSGLTITSNSVTINSIICINRPQVQKIIMNNLITVNGNILIRDNIFIDELTLDLLEEVVGIISIINCSILSIADFSALQECEQIGLLLSAITTIDLSSLVSASKIDISSNSSLVTASVSNATTCLDISFEGCALNTASVNGILADINTAGQAGGVLDLSSGTNSSPTGGVLNSDYVALIGNGWTVNIN
jgi:hypothetical protein